MPTSRFFARARALSPVQAGEPNPVGSPDNLFAPLPGDPGAHGRFDEQSRAFTLWTSLRLRRWLVGAAVAGAAAAPAVRRLVGTR